MGTMNSGRVDLEALKATVQADVKAADKDRGAILKLVEVAGYDPRSKEAIAQVTHLLTELTAARTDLIGVWGLRRAAERGTSSLSTVMEAEEKLASTIADLANQPGGQFLALIAATNIASETLRTKGHLRNRTIVKVADEGVEVLGYRWLSSDEADAYIAESRKLQEAQQQNPEAKVDPKLMLYVLRIGKRGLIQPWIDLAGGAEAALRLKQAKYFHKALKDLLEDVEAARREFRQNRLAAINRNDSAVNGSIEDVVLDRASFAKFPGLSKESPWKFGADNKGVVIGPLYLGGSTDESGRFFRPVAVDEATQRTLEYLKLDGYFTCGSGFSNLKVFDDEEGEIKLDKKEHGRALAFLHKAAGDTKPEAKGAVASGSIRTAHADAPQSNTIGEALARAQAEAEDAVVEDITPRSQRPPRIGYDPNTGNLVRGDSE